MAINSTLKILHFIVKLLGIHFYIKLAKIHFYSEITSNTCYDLQIIYLNKKSFTVKVTNYIQNTLISASWLRR